MIRRRVERKEADEDAASVPPGTKNWWSDPSITLPNIQGKASRSDLCLIGTGVVLLSLGNLFITYMVLSWYWTSAAVYRESIIRDHDSAQFVHRIKSWNSSGFLLPEHSQQHLLQGTYYSFQPTYIKHSLSSKCTDQDFQRLWRPDSGLSLEAIDQCFARESRSIEFGDPMEQIAVNSFSRNGMERLNSDSAILIPLTKLELEELHQFLKFLESLVIKEQLADYPIIVVHFESLSISDIKPVLVDSLEIHFLHVRLKVPSFLEEFSHYKPVLVDFTPVETQSITNSLSVSHGLVQENSQSHVISSNYRSFLAGSFMDNEFIGSFRYIWIISNLKSVSKCSLFQDQVQVMKDKNLSYIYFDEVAKPDQRKTVGLFNTARRFKRQFDVLLPSEDLWSEDYIVNDQNETMICTIRNFFPEESLKPSVSLCPETELFQVSSYNTEMEVLDLEFFKAGYYLWNKYVDSYGGVYLHSWDHGTIRHMGLSIFGNPKIVQRGNLCSSRL